MNDDPEAVMFWSALKEFLQDESGPTAMEYAVMLALIILAIYSSIQLFGGSNDGVWANNNDNLNTKVWGK